MNIPGGDHLQLRDGTALVGKVRNASFSIKPNFSTTPIEVKRERVIWILNQVDGGFTDDMMLLTSGTELRGTLVDETVQLDSTDLGSIEVPMDSVLAVQLLGGFIPDV